MNIAPINKHHRISQPHEWPEDARNRWEVLRGTFFRTLNALNSSHEHRHWQYVPYDQLNENLGLLSSQDPDSVGLIFIESTWKPALRPYHKHKLALLLASQRHYALEQARRGVAIHYIVTEHTPAKVLETEFKSKGPIAVVRPAERELRMHLEPLLHSRQLVELPHGGWLTTRDDFRASMRGKRTWRMDSFYRFVRKKYGVMLEGDGKPLGGKWSHDAENRKPWTGEPTAPSPPRFEVNEVTAEVVALVETRYHHHPGQVSADRIPATIEDVKHYWEWVKRYCLEYFGPYEDAMHHEQRQLFHTRMSSLLNLHRFLPSQLISDVVNAYIPINSKEGLIRQVLGWREYVHHIHEETDGFRDMPAHAHPQTKSSGGAPNVLDSQNPLPPVYWGNPSGLYCLDHAVREVVEDAHSHHINRLMVLSNWASLLDISPRALTDWFWVMFEDAYDWVVEPNVLGMGSFALGELMMTKPYVSGSAYIHKMSSYCDQCTFNPKRNCPMTNLYWSYLRTHAEHFAKNPRMSLVMASLRKRDEGKLKEDELIYMVLTDALTKGIELDPTKLKSLIENVECRNPNLSG